MSGQNCNACNGSSFQEVLNLGKTPIAHRYLHENPPNKEYTHLLAISLCRDCGLIQILNPIPPEELYKDYNLTKEELEKLKSEKYEVQYLEAENKRLKKVLDDIIYLSDSIVAKVIIDKQSPFLRSIIINKGSKNSIKKGMPVLSNNYLIGKVVEVNYLTSRVLLLSDLNSKIPVTIEPDGIQSILSGDGEDSGVIQYTKENVSIDENSIVYTSGTGGLLKAGMPVGKTKQNENQN